MILVGMMIYKVKLGDVLCHRRCLYSQRESHIFNQQYKTAVNNHDFEMHVNKINISSP